MWELLEPHQTGILGESYAAFLHGRVIKIVLPNDGLIGAEVQLKVPLLDFASKCSL